MTFKKLLLIGAVSILYSGISVAQIKMPMLDAELKIHQNLTPGSGSSNGELEFAETTNIYAGAHIQINQYVAVGGFYSRSFRGVGAFRYNEGSTKHDVLQLQKGLDIRLSTSRAKDWRKYLVLSFAQIEMVEKSETLRFADKTNAVGGSLGIMRRLSNNLYLNIIELGVKVMTNEIFWFETSDTLLVIIDGKVGLTYNIGKRK
jgi:hypothetical protein